MPCSPTCLHASSFFSHSKFSPSGNHVSLPYMCIQTLITSQWLPCYHLGLHHCSLFLGYYNSFPYLSPHIYICPCPAKSSLNIAAEKVVILFKCKFYAKPSSGCHFLSEQKPMSLQWPISLSLSSFLLSLLPSLPPHPWAHLASDTDYLATHWACPTGSSWLLRRLILRLDYSFPWCPHASFPHLLQIFALMSGSTLMTLLKLPPSPALKRQSLTLFWFLSIFYYHKTYSMIHLLITLPLIV